MRVIGALGAIAVGGMLLFVLTPTQPQHIPAAAELSRKDDPAKSRLGSTLARWDMQIKGRLRWLGLLPISSGYTAAW